MKIIHLHNENISRTEAGSKACEAVMAQKGLVYMYKNLDVVVMISGPLGPGRSREFSKKWNIATRDIY